MTNESSWNALSDMSKNFLASVCPKCHCQMLDYKLIAGWQKCGACGYTRENPMESEDGHTEFNLIPRP